MKINECVSKTLTDLGTELIFGVVGDVNLFIIDQYVKSGGHYVSAAHESGATLMALGYASVSGQVGVATVTCGPGLTNTLSMLVEGVKARLPLMLITGDSYARNPHYPQKLFHRDFINPTGAGYVSVNTWSNIQEELIRAFRRASSERRPIVFNLPPFDFQWEDVADYKPTALTLPARNNEVTDGTEMENAVGILASAKRPIVLAGYGVVKSEGARASVRELAQRLDAPLMTSLRAKDLYRGDPLNLGVMGISGRTEALDAINVSDCIVAFGASMNFFTTGHGAMVRGKRVVFVIDDAEEVGKHLTADAVVLGDPGSAARRMLFWLDEAEIPSSQFASEEGVRTAVEAIRRPPPLSPPHVQDSLDIREVLTLAEEVVEENRVLVTDGGRFMRQPWQILSVQEPRLFIHGQASGAIGLGIGYAVGTAFAEPERPTLAVVGDGGFMLGGLAEFNTAVRYGLDLIVLVCNDGGYGAEYLHLTDRNLDPSLALFDWPDLAALAQALGGQGLTVRNHADWDQAATLIRNRDRSTPVLLDVQLDPATMPRTF